MAWPGGSAPVPVGQDLQGHMVGFGPLVRHWGLVNRLAIHGRPFLSGDRRDG